MQRKKEQSAPIALPCLICEQIVESLDKSRAQMYREFQWSIAHLTFIVDESTLLVSTNLDRSISQHISLRTFTYNDQLHVESRWYNSGRNPTDCAAWSLYTLDPLVVVSYGLEKITKFLTCTKDLA